MVIVIVEKRNFVEESLLELYIVETNINVVYKEKEGCAVWAYVGAWA